MKANFYRYLFFTWMVAHMLHPVVFGIYCSAIEGDQLFFGWNNLGSVLSFTCLGIIISMPALCLSALSLQAILRISHGPVVALVLWVIAVIASIIMAAYFTLIMFIGFFRFQFLGVFLPGMIAGVIAVLIRYKQFARLVYTVSLNRLATRLYRA